MNLPVLAQTATVTSQPNSVEIIANQDHIKSGQSRTIYIGSTRDLTGVKIYASDLLEDVGAPATSGSLTISEQRHIPKEAIQLDPPQINLTSQDLAQLRVSLSHPDAQPGKYVGNLFLIGNGLSLKNIPITVQINASPNIALTLIALGVLAQFFLTALESKLKLEEAGRRALNYAQDMRSLFISRARGLSKSAQPKVAESNQRLTEARQEFLHGNFRESKNLAEQMGDEYKGISMDLARNDVAEIPNTLKETSSESEKAQDGYLNHESIVIPKVSFRRLFLAPPKKGDYIAFGALSLVVGIAILFAWQSNFVKITPNFGASPIDYITMFTLGFGSQAILSAAFKTALNRI